MKVSDLVSEVLKRCGEGYENWTDRAKAAIKAAVIDLFRSRAYGSNDYQGLLNSKDFTIAGSTGSIAIRDLIGVSVDLITISRIRYKKDVDSDAVDIDIIDKQIIKPIRHNPEITSGIMYAYIYGGNAVFSDSLADSGSVRTDFVHWPSALGSDVTEISDYFAAGFLADVTEQAVKRLAAEVDA